MHCQKILSVMLWGVSTLALAKTPILPKTTASHANVQIEKAVFNGPVYIQGNSSFASEVKKATKTPTKKASSKKPLSKEAKEAKERLLVEKYKGELEKLKKELQGVSVTRINEFSKEPILRGAAYELNAPFFPKYQEVPISEIIPFHGVGDQVIGRSESASLKNMIDLAKRLQKDGFDRKFVIPLIQLPNGKMILGDGHHRLNVMKTLFQEETIPGMIIPFEELSPTSMNLMAGYFNRSRNTALALEAKKIADELIPGNNIKLLDNQVFEESSKVKLSPEQLKAYEGRYEVDFVMMPSDQVDVYVKDGKLFMNYWSSPPIELIPHGQGRFHINKQGHMLEFTTNEQGAVSGVLFNHAGLEAKGVLVTKQPLDSPTSIKIPKGAKKAAEREKRLIEAMKVYEDLKQKYAGTAVPHVGEYVKTPVTMHRSGFNRSIVGTPTEVPLDQLIPLSKVGVHTFSPLRSFEQMSNLIQSLAANGFNRARAVPVFYLPSGKMVMNDGSVRLHVLKEVFQEQTIPAQLYPFDALTAGNMRNMISRSNFFGHHEVVEEMLSIAKQHHPNLEIKPTAPEVLKGKVDPKIKVTPEEFKAYLGNYKVHGVESFTVKVIEKDGKVQFQYWGGKKAFPLKAETKSRFQISGNKVLKVSFTQNADKQPELILHMQGVDYKATRMN